MSPFSVPTLNGNLPQQSGPPSAYLGAQAAPVGQLLGEGLSKLGEGLRRVQDEADRGIARERENQLRSYMTDDAYLGDEAWDGMKGDELKTAMQERPPLWEQRVNDLAADLTPAQQRLFRESAVDVVQPFRVQMLRRGMDAALEQRDESDRQANIGIRATHAAFAAAGGITVKPSITATPMSALGEQPMDLVDPMMKGDLANIDRIAEERLDAHPGDSALSVAEQKAIAKEEGHSEYHIEAIKALLGKGKAQEANAYLKWVVENDGFKGPAATAIAASVQDAFETFEVTRIGTSLWAKHAHGEGTPSENLAKAIREAKGESPDGKRADGTTKGTGYFGRLKRPGGGVSTEISIGVEMDGKEVEIPLLVPGLTSDEKNYLLQVDPRDVRSTDPAMYAAIEEKAVAHAQARMAQGKSPFKNDGQEEPSAPKAIQERVVNKLEELANADRVSAERTADDATLALRESLDRGASPTDVAISASTLPVDHRDAIAKDISNRANRTIVESQSDFYQMWLTKAAGVNPETGEADPKMREEFLAHNFNIDFINAAPDDWARLRAIHKEMSETGKPGEVGKSLITDDEIAQHMTNVFHPDLEGKEREAALYDLKRKLDQFWASERGDGPELSPSQKQKGADLLMGTEFLGAGGGVKNVFDRPGVGTGSGGEPSDLTLLEVLLADPTELDVNEIDDHTRAVIVGQLNASGISRPSDAQIVRQYQLVLGAGLLHDLK